MSTKKYFGSIRDYLESIMLGAAITRSVPKVNQLIQKLPEFKAPGALTKVTGISNPTRLLKTASQAASTALDTAMADAVVSTAQKIPGISKVMNAPSYINRYTVGKIPYIGKVNNKVSAAIATGVEKVSNILGLKGIAKIAKTQKNIYKKGK